MRRETKTRKLGRAEPVEYLLCDVRRAHFYAKAIRGVSINMPPGDPRFDPSDPTAEFIHSLYGMQDAAANWEEE